MTHRPQGRTREEWVRAEKGEHTDHMTSGELCSFLNISDTTLKRRRRAGTIPPPARTTPAGWALWSPQQQQELLQKEMNDK